MFTESYCCIRVNFFIFGTIAWLFSTICKAYCIVFIFEEAWLSGGTTQPLPRDGEATQLRSDPIIEPHARVQTAEPKINLHRGSECKTVKKEMINVLQKVFTRAAGRLRMNHDNCKRL